MSTAAVPSTAYDLSNTYGTVFLTAFLSATLWGTTCTQTFTYFISYPKDHPKDHPWVKCMVIWLWLMDTTHQALVIAAVYGIFVSRFGDVATLAFVSRAFISTIIFTVLVSSTTQLFFAYRIWPFSGKKWIFPLVTLTLVLGQFIPSTIYMIAILKNNTFAGLHKENPLRITSITLAYVTDVALAGCMMYLLRGERSGFDTSDRLVSKLMMFSLNSGLWTALVGLATLVAIPLPTLVYPGLYTMLCPLYCNTVLANLNSRNFLQQSTKNNQSTPHDMPLETFPRSGTARVPQKNILAIQVDTTKATDTYSFQQGDRKASDPSFV